MINWPTETLRANDVAEIEHNLLWLANRVPVSLTAGWPKLLILVTLVVVVRFAPSVKLVTRYVGLSTMVRRIAAGLACATSFSFFTNDAILGARARAAELRVTIVMSQLREQQREAMGKYLAVRVVNEALRATGLATRITCSIR